MQYELSDEQVRTLRQALEEAHDWAAETRSDLRREYGEDSTEVREQDAYLAELQQLLVVLPDLEATDE